LNYISHGSAKTGGYRHEVLVGKYLATSLHINYVECRIEKEFKGLKGFLLLWNYAFKHANGTINLTVQRIALPILLMGIFRRSKTIVVLHHYDRKEQHSWFYHFNMKLLIYLLKIDIHKLRVVVVAQYWKDWLIQRGVKQSNIEVIPNLFDDKIYEEVKTTTLKKQQIYLGQFGAKQHPLVFEIAEELTTLGYYCFFTTSQSNVVIAHQHYEVKKLIFDEYLKELAASLYTVCFTSFNEGWNRTAHESMLLGTPVIGNNAGGLGQLLREANQPIISTKEEVVALILQKQNIYIPDVFLKQYHINQISYYAEPLVAYCSNGFS
jgi:glycosyltransferase involved in cell wall biosynthesis